MPDFSKIFIPFFIMLLMMAKPGLATDSTHVVYVEKAGWHTNLIIPANCMPDSIWPKQFDYKNASWLKIGWGDYEFYPAGEFNLIKAFNAVFLPTASVIHINPISNKNGIYYAVNKAVRLKVSNEKMKRLVSFLLSQLLFNNQNKLISTHKGLYHDSHFFAGSAVYFFPKNSNVWIAMALKHVGYPLFPWYYQTTNLLLNRLAKQGELLH